MPMSTTTDITIAVCTCNRAASLVRTLASLEEQELPEQCDVEVLIVDNGSTDNTADMVGNFADQSTLPIRLVREDHPGVASARNRAVRECTGTWLVFIDDDETAAPGWLKGLFQAAALDGADCVGGRLQLALPDNLAQDIKGTARKHLDETKPPRGFASRFIYTGPGTGNVIIRREIFDRIGLFDETLAYRGEDQDFFRRAAQAGYTIARTEHALIYHHLPADRLTPKALIRTAITNGRSLAYFDRRYGGAWYLLFVMTLRITHAGLLSFPRYVWANIRNDDAAKNGWACSLATAHAYLTEGMARIFSGNTPSGSKRS